MSEPYFLLIEPGDPGGDADLLSIPSTWTVLDVVDVASRIKRRDRRLQLVVDDRTLGLISEEALSPVLLNREGVVRGRARSAVTDLRLRRSVCVVCGSNGWSQAGVLGCPRGHGRMAVTDGG